MAIFSLMKGLHIIAGFTALLLFWIPIVTKKGGKTHVRVGWVYVWAMGTVSFTSFYMGVWRIAFDPLRDADSIAFAWFLIFIAILSSATAWYGIRVLRHKKRQFAHRYVLDVGFPLLLFCSGVAMCVYGYLIGFPLLTWFPLVGIFLGATQLAYWLRSPKQKMHWWYEHIVGMLSCCIATVTAFTVFGAPRLLQVESVHPLVWFFPSILLVPVIIGMTTYYRKKFSQGKNV